MNSISSCHSRLHGPATWRSIGRASALASHRCPFARTTPENTLSPCADFFLRMARTAQDNRIASGGGVKRCQKDIKMPQKHSKTTSNSSPDSLLKPRYSRSCQNLRAPLQACQGGRVVRGSGRPCWRCRIPRFQACGHHLQLSPAPASTLQKTPPCPCQTNGY